jgi:hypothetical protein
MHMMINHRGPFACLTVICLASPALAQSVKLTVPLEQGQVLRYDIAATVEVSTSSGASEKLTQHAVLRLTVAEADPAGDTTLRGAFESLEAGLRDAGGSELSFSWKGGQELAEDASPLAKTYGALGTNPIEVTVSRAGEIKSIDGPDKALEAGDAAKLPHAERALGVLAYHSLPQTLAPILTLDPEGKDRRRGDAWTTTTKLPALGGAAIRVITERTLKDFKGTDAIIAAEVTQSWQPAQGKADPTDPTGVPADQKGSADERWDTKIGRLASRTQDLTVTWKLELQTSPPLASTRTIRSHIELKRLESAPKAAPPTDEKP